MFRGEQINITEDRAVLHVALRAPEGAVIVVDGENVVPEVHAVLARWPTSPSGCARARGPGTPASASATSSTSASAAPTSGRAWPTRRSRDFSDADMTFRFVSNVDGTDFWEATRDLDPGRDAVHRRVEDVHHPRDADERAHRARLARSPALGDDAAVAKHFVAVSTNAEEVAEFGIDTANMFEFWDWVGGRYSFDSAIGLSLMIAIGPEQFREMLAGFHVDRRALPHRAVRARTCPCCSGLHRHLVRRLLRRRDRTRCCPYSQYLARFPAYLQQLDMESNGKSVDLDGQPGRRGRPARSCGASRAPTASTPSTSSSTRARSSSRATSSGSCSANHEVGDHHDLLMANFFAQTEALAFGKTPDEVEAEGVPAHQVPHRTFAGNHPTNTILRDAADAVRARPARRALRAQGVHPGHDLGHQLLRPVGRRARQGARRSASSPSSARAASRRSPRQLDQRADPPLPAPAHG